MKTFLLFLVSLFAGFTVISGYSYWHEQKFGSYNKSVQAVTTDFSLKNAPRDSLTGNIASVSGTVKWFSRAAQKQINLHASDKIQQGDAVSTGKNGTAVVVVNNKAAIALSQNAAVSFIQMLPVNVVLEQNNGVVSYQNTIQLPLSVRSLDLVTLIVQGTVILSVDQKNKTVTVTVNDGTANEGYKDTQNNNNAVTLTAGQRFVFNDTTREATITEIPGFVSHDSSPFGN